MSYSQIEEMRKKIDTLNLDILKLLSQRGQIAKDIGHIQTSMGLSSYDPKRELEMLQALTDANEGPFDDATVKSLFKSVFQASMVRQCAIPFVLEGNGRSLYLGATDAIHDS